MRGTLPYMAPEIIRRKTYDGAKADIFSVGVILFIMMHGIFPFNSASSHDVYYNLVCNRNIDFYSQDLQCRPISIDLKLLLL